MNIINESALVTPPTIAPNPPLLNDTLIGGATTLGSGVKCAVVCQMAVIGRV
jgi:hypothetical protein